MKRWEYKKITFDHIISEIELDRLGELGWELCTGQINIDESIYIFKREIQQ